MTDTSAHKVLIVQTDGAQAFFKSLAVIAAICAQHKGASISFLTRKSLADMADRSRWFAAVIREDAAAFYHLPARLAHLAALRRSRFTHVYTLSATPLSFAARVALHGAAFVSGMPEISAPPNTDWLQNDVSFFGLQKPYVVLFPGRDENNWTAARYAATALKLIREGYDIALLGTDAESARLAKICRTAPGAKDLGGRTSYYDIASLARDADCVIGAQSGALQLAALVGAPVVAFLRAHEDPEADAPQGAFVTVIQAEDIADITVEDVLKNMRPRMSSRREGRA